MNYNINQVTIIMVFEGKTHNSESGGMVKDPPSKLSAITP